MMWRLALGAGMWSAVIAGLLACSGGPPPETFCIRRTAVVPVPAPSLRPAKQTSGIIETGVGDDTVLLAKPPKKLEGRNRVFSILYP